MSARRLVGLETEYGIIRPSMPKANSTVLSAQIVDAYAQLVAEQDSAAKAARWDYTDESPLRNRGWRTRKASGPPSPLPWMAMTRMWDPRCTRRRIPPMW